MSVVRSLQTTVITHPLAMIVLAFALGSVLASANVLGTVLGLFIHALNLAWLVVGGLVMVVSVWLICLSFERRPHVQ